MNARVLEVAHAVRDVFEAEQPYAPAWSPNLAGACACASWNLRRALRHIGVEAIFVVGLYLAGDRSDEREHAWVTVDGSIVDVTATQFGIRRRVHVTAGKRYREDRRGRAAVRLVNDEWGRDRSMTETWFRSCVLRHLKECHVIG